MLDTAPRTIHFAEFEVDIRTAELRKNGSKIKLEGQPFQILALLLERPADLVTRDEVRQRLWGNDTFVDFERCINEAVKRLREALGDSADEPRFIETLRGRGYRFIYPMADERRLFRRLWLLLAAALAAGVLVAAIVGRNIIRGRPPSQQNRPAPIESLAVLPLQNLSAGPEQNYFADGVTEAISTEVGKITSLRVISRQSVMRYRSTRKPIAEIARDLNVDAVVEGSVARERDHVSITVQLVQVRPERQLWGERYDRRLTNILELQRDIARGIAGEIRTKLIPAQQHGLSPTRTINAEAYESYLKGLYYIDKPGTEGIRKSSDYFRHAIDIDPTYAPAWVGLADTYNRAAIQGLKPGADAYPLAKAAVARALKLDESLPDAYVLAGVIKFRFDWDWAGAERDLKHALELNPSSSRAHLAYDTFLQSVGHIDAATNEAQRALQLDPLAPQRHMDVALKLTLAARYDAAVAQLRKTLELMPDSSQAYAMLARIYSAKGMQVEAISCCNQALSYSDDPPAVIHCAIVYAKAGRANEARQILERLIADPGTSPYQIAYLYDGLGDTQKALRWLDRAFTTREAMMCNVRADFSPELRAEPRFRDLVRRMNFPP